MEDGPGEFDVDVNDTYSKKRPLATMPPKLLLLLPDLPPDLISVRRAASDSSRRAREHHRRRNSVRDPVPRLRAGRLMTTHEDDDADGMLAQTLTDSRGMLVVRLSAGPYKEQQPWNESRRPTFRRSFSISFISTCTATSIAAAFFDRAAKFAVGGVTVAGLFEALRPNYAWAQQVAKDDARIRTEYATVQSPQGNGSIKGYLARPAAAGKYPAVLVVHENRGLNPYVEDVARRLGTANFLAFAPDGLTSVGGYPGDDERGGQLFGKSIARR